MFLKRSIILLLFLCCGLAGHATHIVGGEIYYDCLGGNNYRVTLKIYRDCFLGMAPYDDPATIFIFDNAGNFHDSIEIPFPGSVVLPATINNPCFLPPTNICVEEAIYQTVVNLPSSPGGYNIVYQRCCRNNSILNIINPGDVGSTYMAHIPDPSLAICNSSPRYNNFPPIFLCSGVPLFFDHSATDPDGDSLYYEFCDPYTGLSAPCPILGAAAAAGCATIASPPPYIFVPWAAPYNASFPMSSSPAMAVNSTTGMMTGTPDMIGQWVVGVCVSEYRNGVLLDVNKRDFQFNVVNCPGLPVASVPQQTTFCFGYQVNFTQASLNAFTYHWDFGVPGISTDTSNLVSPTYVYPDSGIYTVQLIINPGTLCADTNSTTFYIYPLLDPSFVPPAGECIYDNSFSFNAGGAYMGNGTFVWDFGTHATPNNITTENATNIVFDTSGTFPVTLTVSENGCIKSYTANVNVYPKPVANYGIESGVACDLQPVHFLDSSQTTSPLSYYWTFGDGVTSSEQNPFHTYPSIGNYLTGLIITDAHGCADTFALASPLSVYPSPVAGFDISPHDTSIFYPDISMWDYSIGGIGCSVFWGDGATYSRADSSHHYTAPGNYQLMQVVTNANGCRDTAYQDLIIRPEFLFWIPNAFTPNENGLNDVFKPTLLGVHNYHFMIFDRWGEMIYETHDPAEGWNGHYQSHLCSNDVYVYRITFADDVLNEDHQYIGRVTLVR